MADNCNKPATGDNRDLGVIRTVGQFRAALDGIADDTPLMVNTEDVQDAQFIDEQLITSVGFGRVDWGDGYGLEQDTVFGVSCRSASSAEIADIRKRPNRPRKSPHQQVEEAGR